MFSEKINSYKGYTGSKKIYLKRKKELNRELNRIKKKEKLSKGFRKRYYRNQINKGYDDIYILNIIYRYYKKEKRNLIQGGSNYV